MKSIRKTSYITYSKCSVPYIRLSGKWLEKLGFSIGTKFILSKQGDKLLLNPLKYKHHTRQLPDLIDNK